MKNKNMTKEVQIIRVGGRRQRGRVKNKWHSGTGEEAAILVRDSRRDGSTKPASITYRNLGGRMRAESGHEWAWRPKLSSRRSVLPTFSFCGATIGGGAVGLVPVVTNQRSNRMQVWPSGGGASLALGRVAALVGAGASTWAEAGLLCHASTAGGASRSAAAAPYSLTGTAGPSWTARPLVPPVALSGRPGLLLFHVQSDVAAELYRL